jgi:DNA invertase Pin-like site-specific DNA recombinase
MKHGIAYCRVSSKEQIEGTSLESQELACWRLDRRAAPLGGRFPFLFP